LEYLENGFQLFPFGPSNPERLAAKYQATHFVDVRFGSKAASQQSNSPLAAVGHKRTVTIESRP
jgi:hypothetical protein